MKTTRYIVIALIIQFFCMSKQEVWAQNFVENGGFEQGDFSLVLIASEHRTGYCLSYWRPSQDASQSNNNTLDLHSPDWRYNDPGAGINVGLPYNTDVGNGEFPPASGKGMLGMGKSELVEQAYNYEALNDALRVQSGHPQMLLRFKIRIPDTDITEVFPEAKLSVFLSKNKMEYIDNANRCTDNYSEIGNGYNSYEAIYTENDLEGHFPPGQWYQVTKVFDVPEKMDKYEWISFNIKPFEEKSGCSSVYKDYIYIDDVELLLGCPDECSRTDGVYPLQIVTSNVISASSVFQITNAGNLQDITFSVYDDAGNIVYTNQASCINGIDHMIVWDGTNNQHVPVANAIYPYVIIVKNDCGERRYEGKLLKMGDYSGGDYTTNFNASCNNGANKTPEPCCALELDMYKDYETLIAGSGQSQYILANNIYACTATPDFSDEVKIVNGADILFRAGLQITLDEGFHTEKGAIFVAEIELCEHTTFNEPGGGLVGGKTEGGVNTGLVKEYNSQSHIEVSVYPNPTSGSFSIHFNTLDAGAKLPEYAVYNLIGDEVFSGRMLSNELSLDLSGLPKGMYFVKVAYEDQTTTHKVMYH